MHHVFLWNILRVIEPFEFIVSPRTWPDASCASNRVSLALSWHFLQLWPHSGYGACPGECIGSIPPPSGKSGLKSPSVPEHRECLHQSPSSLVFVSPRNTASSVAYRVPPLQLEHISCPCQRAVRFRNLTSVSRPRPTRPSILALQLLQQRVAAFSLKIFSEASACSCRFSVMKHTRHDLARSSTRSGHSHVSLPWL